VLPPSRKLLEVPLEPLGPPLGRLVLGLEPLELLAPLLGPDPELDSALASDKVPLPQTGVDPLLSDDDPHAGKMPIRAERSGFDRVRMATFATWPKKKPQSEHDRTDDPGTDNMAMAPLNPMLQEVEGGKHPFFRRM
jgi:hypothetical protein